MSGTLERILARFGQTVTVERRQSGEELNGRAFLQPILRQLQSTPIAATPLGAVYRNQWLYLSRVGVAPGDLVTQGGRKFVVQEARRIYWQDEILYCRAILEAEKEAAI